MQEILAHGRGRARRVRRALPVACAILSAAPAGAQDTPSIAGWQPGVYLALILVWALPPIGLQLAFGADILWQQRRLLLPAFVSLTLYLGAADALAIREGTWTIDPAQSLGLYLGGVLPIEEFLFFAITNMLLLFGVTLLWAGASHERLASLRRRAADWRGERRRRTVGAYSSPVEETRSRS